MSRIVAEPMPTLCIASKSAVMPSSVIFPSIQCHHVRGNDSTGGLLKPDFRLSEFSAIAKNGSNAKIAAYKIPIFFIELISFTNLI